MEKQKAVLIPNLLFFFALITGALVRLYAVWQAGFIVHDGGLFYTLVQNIESANYTLPMFTSYNQASIPFAYPPLAFYLLAVMNGLFGISLFFLLRWLPAIISILTIPCFYQLARTLLGGDEKAALATVLFALAPQSLGPQIMGGGISRSIGTVFTLLFLYYLYGAFTTQGWRSVAAAAVFGALVILTHPEWTIHAVIAAVVFMLFFGRSRKGVMRAIGVTLSVGLLSAPWWGAVLVRYGLAPFQAAMHAPGSFKILNALLTSNWTAEIVPMLFILAVIGVGLGFFTGNSFLSVWLILDLLVEPRGAMRTDTIELALLATVTIYSIQAFRQKKKWHDLVNLSDNRIGWTILSLVALLALFNGLGMGEELSHYHVLSTADRQAFAWVRENTAASSRFLILAPQDIFMSPAIEWFPALTGRISLLTTQGLEWLAPPRRGYQATYQLSKDLEPCRLPSSSPTDLTGVPCLSAWSKVNAESYDYVYFTSAFSDALNDTRPDALYKSLLVSEAYTTVYQSATVQIFSIQHK